MVQQAKMAAQQKYMSSKGSSTPSSSTSTPAPTSNSTPTKSSFSSFTPPAPKPAPTPTKSFSFNSDMFNSSGAQARAMANRASQVNSYRNAAISQGTLNTGKSTNVSGIGGRVLGKSSK